MNDLTITQAIERYLESVKLARSPNTRRTYTNAMHVLMAVLKENDLDPQVSPTAGLSEDAMVWMAVALKDYSPSSEQLYLAATTSFFKFLSAEKLADVNLPRLDLLRTQRARRSGQRLPQFPREDIERVLEFVINISTDGSTCTNIRLRAMRDRAFLLTLADTGLRVHEACNLRRGDMTGTKAVR